MFEGVATAHTCAHPTNNAGTSLGNNCSPSRTSPYGSVHPHLARDAHSPVRASGVENDGSCPTACDTAPMLGGGVRSFRNWSVHQEKRLRRVGLCQTALASLSQEALGHVPTMSQRIQHRSGLRSRNSAKSSNSFQQCRKIRHGQSPGGRLPSLPLTLRHKLGTLPRHVHHLTSG